MILVISMFIVTSSLIISIFSVIVVALSNTLMTAVVMNIQNESITSRDTVIWEFD